MSYGVIYKATNLINMKCYVGMTSISLKVRKKDHLKNAKLGGTTYFYNALNKYGSKNFIWEQIDTAKTSEELREKEIFWIWLNNSYGDNGYNLTLGGDGSIGYKWTEKQKHDASQSRRRGDAHPLFGKKRNEETVKKMVEGRKKNNPYLRGEGFKPRLGITPKIEKNVIKNFIIGSTISELSLKYKLRKPIIRKILLNNLDKNIYDKICAANKSLHCHLFFKGRKHSEESKTKMRESALDRKESMIKNSSGKNNGRAVVVDIDKILQMNKEKFSVKDISIELNVSECIVKNRIETPEKYR